MTLPVTPDFAPIAPAALAAAEGRLVLVLTPDGRLGAAARQ